MISIENLNLQLRPHQQVPHSASNLHTLPYLQNRVKYMHQTFFCPPHSTLLAAINNHQLKGCPFMTAYNVRKYLPTRVRSEERKVCRDTGHSLVQGSPVVNKTLTASPLKITLPNGKMIQSTHTCNLDILWLPNTVTEAYIVPGLSHSSLISKRKITDLG